MAYKFSMILSFLSILLYSTANSEVYFYILLCEINCITIQTMSLVLNYFSRDSLCFIDFDHIIRQQLKKSSSYLDFFFSHTNEVKTWSCATTDTAHAQRSYLTVA